MKREFLEALDLGNGVKLSKEAVDSIMAENGKDINAEKAKTTAAETNASQLQTQLTDANKTIEGFKAMDIDGIKKAADDWKTKAENAQKDFDAKLSKMAYDAAAEKFIDGLKPKDALSKKAILAEFTAKGFKLEGESFVGGKEWADEFKKANETHFEGTKQAPGIFSGKLGTPPAGGNPAPAETLKSALYERYNN